jgi:hypothetical protein
MSIANQNMSKPVPEPRQLLVIQEHHEVRQHRVAVDAARTNLPHEVHAHGVAAEREERGMTEREDPAVAPDEIDGHRQQRVRHVLADERHRVARELQRGTFRPARGATPARECRRSRR